MTLYSDALPASALDAPPDESPAERLERGELLYFPVCPFPLPEADDLRFLRRQERTRIGHKNISFDPATAKMNYRGRVPGERARLIQLLAAFSTTATTWLRGYLKDYADGLHADRASLRTEEEAIRALRWSARNDLLHIDSFPTRPAFGRRLLRLYVNINPSEPRVWAISETFRELLPVFGPKIGITPRSVAEWCSPLPRWKRLLNLSAPAGSLYDDFMLRLHHRMKQDDDWQEDARKRYHPFPPGSAWLLYADALSHAVLRGQFALEHSYFVDRQVLLVPDESPVEQLAGYAPRSAYLRAG